MSNVLSPTYCKSISLLRLISHKYTWIYIIYIDGTNTFCGTVFLRWLWSYGEKWTFSVKPTFPVTATENPAWKNWMLFLSNYHWNPQLDLNHCKPKSNSWTQPDRCVPDVSSVQWRHNIHRKLITSAQLNHLIRIKLVFCFNCLLKTDSF